MQFLYNKNSRSHVNSICLRFFKVHVLPPKKDKLKDQTPQLLLPKA